MKAGPVLTCGDRSEPRLLVAQELRVVPRTSTMRRCPLYSCTDTGQLCFAGFMPIDAAHAVRVAGEA